MVKIKSVAHTHQPASRHLHKFSACPKIPFVWISLERERERMVLYACCAKYRQRSFEVKLRFFAKRIQLNNSEMNYITVQIKSQNDMRV